MKNNKTWKMLLIIMMIIAAVVIGVTMYNNNDAVKVRKQLDLGQKYLSEMNYEEAVVAFNQAIEIDPRSADAYLGLADAYLGLGDEEAALVALEAGYEATGDERLKERIDELKAAINSEAEIVKSVEDDERIAERVHEIHRFIMEETLISWSAPSEAENHFLTYDQIEAAYRPLAEELEMYLEQVQEEWEVIAWEDLADIYCYLGEMEKCLETRRRGYESTGRNSLRPEEHREDIYVIDEYGRIIGDAERSMTYGEGDRLIMLDTMSESAENSYTCHYEYEYDNLGRISKVYRNGVYSSTGAFSIEYSHEYQEDNFVVVTLIFDNGGRYTGTYTYDEYGVIINRTDPDFT